MVPITAHFESEAPLKPELSELLAATFGRGWADPTKIHADSRRVSILLQEAKESLAANLAIAPTELFFLGEPTLGFHLGISGLLSPDSRLIHQATDRSEVFACATFFQNQGGNVICLPVGIDGSTGTFESNNRDLRVWQLSNGETGAINGEVNNVAGFTGAIFADATSSPLVPLPLNWSTALWDAQSWGGLSGLGIFAISNELSSKERSPTAWRNPLPCFDNNPVPDNFSVPLALLAAISLEHWLQKRTEDFEKVFNINRRIREFIRVQIPNSDIAGQLEKTLPDFLSVSFLYVDAERLVSDLNDSGFSVDSGSACNSKNMEPSHVLAAMGLLTQGNIRLRIRSDLEMDQIDTFLQVLKITVENLRSS